MRPVLRHGRGIVETAAFYLERAKQCRRLARAAVDERTVESLTAMAEEFEADAKATKASAPPVDPGSDIDGSPV